MSLKTALFLQKLLAPLFILLLKMVPNRVYPILQREAPSGPNAVGVRDVECLSVKVSAQFKVRRVMARIWYPAEDIRGLSRRPLLKEHELFNAKIAISQVQRLPEVIAEQIGRSLTWAFENAKLAESTKGKLPVLIYSHGFGLTLDANTQLCEHLASHGYIVIAVTHPLSSLYVNYSNGSASFLDLDLVGSLQSSRMLNIVDSIINATVQEDRKQATLQWSLSEVQNELQEQWIDDTLTCIDSLLSNACDADVADIVQAGNFQQLGAFGMSFGGSVSVALAERDKRFKATINLDGGQVGSQLVGVAPRVPLLMLHSSIVRFANGGSFNDFHYQSPDVQTNAKNVTRAKILGADHNDFTDLTLYDSALLKRVLMLGGIKGKRMTLLINQLCLTFFDGHIKADKATSVDVEFNALAEQCSELKFFDAVVSNTDECQYRDKNPSYREQE